MPLNTQSESCENACSRNENPVLDQMDQFSDALNNGLVRYSNDETVLDSPMVRYANLNSR